MNPPREIHLHIERLILDGLPMDRTQGALFVAALETELAERFRNSGLQTHVDAALASVGTRPIHLGVQMSAERAGADIARSVHQAAIQVFQLSGGRAAPAQKLCPQITHL